jgi:tRNA(Ile)-lysidine synthase
MKPKSSNVQNHSNFLQDKIILETYFQFEKVAKKYVGSKKFVACISGGPDSLALAVCSKIYSEKHHTKVYYLIVDHNIRKNSAKEAKSVQANLLKICVEAKILTITKKISTSIQKNARDHRYKLMSNFCKKNKISSMMTAHHLDDQIENFYIRLSRGSGLYGLSSMKITDKNKDKINIVRPFLSNSKEVLVKIAKKIFKTFVKDPSNINDRFLRSRIRKLKYNLSKEGLDQNRILKTIHNLGIAKDAIDFYVKQSEKRYIQNYKSKSQIDLKLFQEQPLEVIYRVMAALIKKKSKKDYPPRAKGIEHAIQSIQKKNFKKTTLGGFVFSLDEKKIIMSKENRNI